MNSDDNNPLFNKPPSGPVHHESTGAVVSHFIHNRELRPLWSSSRLLFQLSFLAILLIIGGVLLIALPKHSTPEPKASLSLTQSKSVTSSSQAPTTSSTPATAQTTPNKSVPTTIAPTTSSTTVTTTTTTTAPSSSPPAAVSYDTVIDEFLSAIQSGNKTNADSLESSRLQQAVQNSSGTTSFYSACVAVGSDCTNSLSATYLTSASSVTTSTFTDPVGTMGEERQYVINTSSCNSQTCTGTTYQVEIGVTPSGNTWQVDELVKSGNPFPGQV